MRWLAICALSLTACGEMIPDAANMPLLSSEQEETLDWLRATGESPDCLTQPWPQCIRKPASSPLALSPPSE